ncbi:Protein of unknown function [Pyronema omphalodes CBS 100304]|uniref:Uncharacterized protein n=1 Tax=Pyronema omphalodes (strain CBS 100304) TaxID=1076935 RepID=U4L603_PYROM|nr:Protein of unknown function [Pyronema omphalodes CBS 100304]
MELNPRRTTVGDEERREKDVPRYLRCDREEQDLTGNLDALAYTRHWLCHFSDSSLTGTSHFDHFVP